jgi:hypothetical protein
MVTISAADFAPLIGIVFDPSDANVITPTNLEKVIDQAIDLLNLYNCDLSNLQGTIASKSLSVEGKVRGAVYLVARTIYANFYKTTNASGGSSGGSSSTSVSLGPLSSSSSSSTSLSDIMSNVTVMDNVKEAAAQLREFEWSRAII